MSEKFVIASGLFFSLFFDADSTHENKSLCNMSLDTRNSIM
jgi:hypothetical protein